MRLKSKQGQRGGTILLLMCGLPLLILPLVGLGIDATRIYIVQSKLSAAVDGAALGAGRLLGTVANTTEIAGEFLTVNFPPGYWGTNGLTPNITYSNNLGTQTITVNASVTVPLTLIRVLGFSNSVIGTTAVATRRVTRVVIVLDRSGSMNHNDPVTGQNVFTTMKAGAQWFASQFTPGYDELGLVVFSGGGVVAYPTNHPWVNDPNGAGGPDKNFATDPANQVGPIFDQLDDMGVGGGTNMSEALSMAYVELQKAHNRDLAINGVDNTLNTIVLFTDGVPSTMSIYPNNPNANFLKPFGTNTYTQSKCTYNPATAGSSGAALATQMRGYVAAPGNPPGPSNPYPGWSTTTGLFRLGAYDTTYGLTWWLSNTGAADSSRVTPISSVVGCRYLYNNGTGGVSSGNQYLNDLAKIPDADLYGNSTTGQGYTHSQLSNGTNTWYPNTGTYDPYNIASSAGAFGGYNVAAACWNATDAIGSTIRAQTAMNQVQIFTIGYTGSNPGTDIGLLTRLANTPASTSYVSTQPNGKFYQVNTTAELAAAFDAVASSLLRLAQ
jgi:hypothetical protein